MTLTHDAFSGACQVDPAADDSTIKKAFHGLAKVAHPDKTRGLAQSEYAFGVVKKAFDVLKDPNQRRQFDALRRVHIARNTSAGSQGFGGVGGMGPGGYWGARQPPAAAQHRPQAGYQQQTTPDNVRMFRQMQEDIKKQKRQAAAEREQREKRSRDAAEEQGMGASEKSQRFKFQCPACAYFTEINGDDYVASQIEVPCNICLRRLKVTLSQKRHVSKGRNRRTPARSFPPSGIGDPLSHKEVTRLRGVFADKKAGQARAEPPGKPVVIDLLDSDEESAAPHASAGNHGAAAKEAAGSSAREPVPADTARRMKSVFKFQCPKCKYFTEIDGDDYATTPAHVECSICASVCSVTLPNKPNGLTRVNTKKRKHSSRGSFAPTPGHKKLTNEEIQILRRKWGAETSGSTEKGSAEPNQEVGRGPSNGAAKKRPFPEVIQLSDDEEETQVPKKAKRPNTRRNGIVEEVRDEDRPPGHPLRSTGSGRTFLGSGLPGTATSAAAAPIEID